MESLGVQRGGAIGVLDGEARATTWRGAVDRAVGICGSQAALARHLRVPRQHVSEARSGGRTIPTDRLPALAQLIDVEPARLWELQEIANIPRRNPFLREPEPAADLSAS
ncbi:YdaS family helix-turn-helix protein [Mitsuaria sp. GD03876]|uniref:YdaS family helix-turn-helix protein n=1 Tax=Mitsuaria sp. GD03876 TaxID=2975399 RepID=UPI0024483A02|nr:YdaS family helix-turn-helix protein [Mitsuaria sp. GD03876]MDH0863833.1 helix-turn-helix domain-containing protein [Mitsuaria sp. GD03876]